MPSACRSLARFAAGFVVLALAGCATSGAPSPNSSLGAPAVAHPADRPPTTTSKPPATTTTTAPAGPSAAASSTASVATNLDVCAALQAAPTGGTVTIQGNRAQPIDLGAQASTAPTGRCHFAADTDDVTVRTVGTPLLLGELTISLADGWLFDGLAMTPTAGTDHDPLVVMIGGDGFRWTNCDLFASGVARGAEHRQLDRRRPHQLPRATTATSTTTAVAPPPPTTRTTTRTSSRPTDIRRTASSRTTCSSVLPAAGT